MADPQNKWKNRVNSGWCVSDEVNTISIVA